MKRRYTDADKWDDGWFLNLHKDHKLIWSFILDTCTNAGRWVKNFKMLQFCCETNITEDEFKQIFNGRVIDCGDFFFIPKFLRFQNPKGVISNKPAVISIRNEIIQYNLLDMIRQALGNDYPIIRQSLPNDVMDRKGIGIGKEKEKKRKKNPQIKEIQDYFYSAYQKTTDSKYIANFGKDGTIFKNLLTVIEIDKLKKLIDDFFKSEDAFIQKSGYTTGVFLSQINKLQAGDPKLRGIPEILHKYMK